MCSYSALAGCPVVRMTVKLFPSPPFEDPGTAYVAEIERQAGQTAVAPESGRERTAPPERKSLPSHISLALLEPT